MNTPIDPSHSGDLQAQPMSPPPTLAVSSDRQFWRLSWMSALAGALYGLLMRGVFGLLHNTSVSAASGPMLVSFLFLVPFVIGALTVYLQPQEKRSVANAILRPWLPMFLFLVGSALLLIEGSICIFMAAPIFFAMSSIGGVLSWAILKTAKPSNGVVGSFLLLPLLGGVWERSVPIPDAILVSERSLHVQAAAAQIWQLINNATAIQPDEMRAGWAYRIGVPYPQEALTVTNDGARVRKLRWDKNVHFDEPILDWQENRYIRWQYDFANDSIPAAALDEHVTLGGKYFDLLDTSYLLTPDSDGTLMQIRVSYRVSTNFNFYAAWWAGLLVDNSADTILTFYKRRAEAAPILPGNAITLAR
ncbi:SRPBCC family protein [Pseudolysobacter antarcticus]|nr:SRPBCC family protein [Pseudolysobacter antarcticus]